MEGKAQRLAGHPGAHRQPVGTRGRSARVPGAAPGGPAGAGLVARLSVTDILESLPFYVLLVDEDHRILQANRAVRVQLGLEPSAVIGQYCPKVIHGLDAPWHACPLEEAVAKGEAVEREALDPASGLWIRSAVYPTGRLTADGKRVFFHMVSDITNRKRVEEELQTSREQLRSLSAHLESVREEERTSVAREIHDELGQMLTALKIDMSWLAKRLPRQDSLLDKTAGMSEILDGAIQTVKRISADLRPGVLDDLGLTAAIEWQGQEFEKRTDLRFEFTSLPRDIVLDRDRSTAIFRIFQEALTNVVRHANASEVRVSLTKDAGRVVLTVKDNGRGIKKRQLADPKAFGLIGMRERARSLGGEASICGSAGSGTTVTVSVPISGVEKISAENTDRR